MPYCKNCGNELKPKANFCGNCGEAVRNSAKEDKRIDDDSRKTTGELLLSLKPTFVPVVKIAPLLVPFGIFILFMAVFLYLTHSGSGEPLPTFVYIFLGFFTFMWIGMPLIQMYFQKRTYDETEYKIYDNRVEYAEGFFSVQNNRVQLNRVIDVHYKQSVPQKWYNLGTISLDLSGGGSKNAITFKDIADPEQIYTKLDELITQNTI